jgi:Membrane glycosyltransferase
MRPSKFDERQIAQALREVSKGASAAQVCRDLGISGTTFYRWRKERAGNRTREIKELREENKKLRVIVANFLLDKIPIANHLLPPAAK